MLSVDQRGLAVRRLAGGQQQGITALAHHRIGTEHGAKVQAVVVGQVALGGQHHHAGDKALLVAAPPFLPIVDPVQGGVRH